MRFVRGDVAKGPDELTTTYERLIDELQVGDSVMLADGTVTLIVEQRDEGSATCRVIYGDLHADTVTADIMDRKALLDVTPPCDVVFHLAARTDLAGRAPDDYAANTQGTANAHSLVNLALVAGQIGKPATG